MFSCECSKSFRDSFFIEQLQWLLLNKILLSESLEFSKKKVSGEIAFALISLFQEQMQEPASKSTTTRAFVFFVKFTEFSYQKIFETRSR